MYKTKSQIAKNSEALLAYIKAEKSSTAVPSPHGSGTEALYSNQGEARAVVLHTGRRYSVQADTNVRSFSNAHAPCL